MRLMVLFICTRVKRLITNVADGMTGLFMRQLNNLKSKDGFFMQKKNFRFLAGLFKLREGS